MAVSHVPGSDGPNPGEDGAQPLSGDQTGPVPADDVPADDGARLELGDDDVRLPWLESADDDDGDGGSGSGELVRFALLGLLALAVLVGGIWWFTRSSADEEVVADGSTIEAPGEPYKQPPEDPQGKTFEGTGDTSFAVSAGQDRPVRLGEGQGQGPNAGAPAGPSAAPSPGFASVPKPAVPAGAAGPKPSAAAAAPAQVSGVGVQVGAYSTRARAEEGWSNLLQRSQALTGVSHRVVEGKADIGTVYRLQAVAPDAAAARALCGRLKADGVACQVKN